LASLIVICAIVIVDKKVNKAQTFCAPRAPYSTVIFAYATFPLYGIGFETKIYGVFKVPWPYIDISTFVPAVLPHIAKAGGRQLIVCQ